MGSGSIFQNSEIGIIPNLGLEWFFQIFRIKIDFSIFFIRIDFLKFLDWDWDWDRFFKFLLLGLNSEKFRIRIKSEKFGTEIDYINFWDWNSFYFNLELGWDSFPTAGFNLNHKVIVWTNPDKSICRFLSFLVSQTIYPFSYQIFKNKKELKVLRNR